MSTTNPTDVSHAQLVELLVDALDRGAVSLPVMPDVAVRVNEAVRERGVNAKGLARIIEASPGLSARILKLANSSMYSGVSEIRDLSHAIGRLGTTMVLAVVVGAAGKETFHSDDPDWAATLEYSWMGSVFASVAARSLGERLSQGVDICFLSGLLHGVGEPILVQTAERFCKSGQIERLPSSALSAAIQPLVPQAGARLLGSWGIPEEVVGAVEHQSAPGDAPDQHKTLAALTGLAAEYGRRQAQGKDPAETLAAVAELAGAELLDLDQEALEPILNKSGEDGMTVALAF